MSKKFAKLYETDDIGQILVVHHQNDEGGPSVAFSVNLPTYGVCTIRANFSDDEKGRDRAEAVFAESDEAFSRSQLAPVLKLCNGEW